MLLNAYERSDLGQSRFIHARLEALLANAELELSVLRESRGKESLRRKAVRRQKEITRALAWSKKLVEGKGTPTLSWAMVVGGLTALLTHFGSVSKDEPWDRRLYATLAIIALGGFHGSWKAWREKSAYERLLPRILAGVEGGASGWFEVQALEPE